MLPGRWRCWLLSALPSGAAWRGGAACAAGGGRAPTKVHPRAVGGFARIESTWFAGVRYFIDCPRSSGRCCSWLSRVGCAAPGIDVGAMRARAALIRLRPMALAVCLVVVLVALSVHVTAAAAVG